ncbi:MAG TPA: YcaO-like family protein [Acidimicrobiales bacterium]|nr:YcaO-like family protein [Acidimicrobiales bacterium]
MQAKPVQVPPISGRGTDAWPDAAIERYAPEAEVVIASGTGRKAVTAGTHRCRSLEETAALLPQLQERFGISRVANITGLDHLRLPVFNAYRPFAATGNITVAQGKGASPTAAAVSAAMEAVEHACAEPGGHQPLQASFEQLRQRRLRSLDPRALVLPSKSAWTPSEVIGWLPAREMLSGQVWLLPAVAVLLACRDDISVMRTNTTGLASGNNAAEAVLHALLEIIERDATSMAEASGKGWSVPLEDLPPGPADLARAIVDGGLALRLFAYAHPTAIPTFFALADDLNTGDGMLINGGAGTHVDPVVAASRALSEVVQSRLGVISGAREDLARYKRGGVEDYRRKSAAVQSFYSDWPVKRFGEFSVLATDNVSDDLRYVLSLLAELGWPKVFVSVLSPPDVPVTVARVVVPGMELSCDDPARVGPRAGAARMAAGSPS